jgi:class 3 adenylate cyclase/DNA-binding winged helix-turn-helix (wHTH) protein/tetratricopeptide (TPR) repeat protein
MIYIFADCELDTHQRLLKCAGQDIHLRSQAYKVLLHLLENRDRVFSQADLIDALWLDPFVKPWTVETTIREIRRAVGDSIKTQRVIETRPRQGYRFIAHLKGPFEIIDPAEPAVSATTGEPESWPCPICQHLNRVVEPQRSRFCTQCGAPFGLACPQCQEVNGPRDKFCGACGYALSSPRPDASGEPDPSPPSAVPERRQLTVLSCDLVESVALAEQVDLEDYRDIIYLYRDMCNEMIRHYEGHIAHDLGAGLLVYFGHPRSHEDDAQRAVRTGLAITEGLATLNARLQREKHVTLAVRWGVYTGPVVVEDAANASQAGAIALGEVLNVAQQIQRLAAPGEGVIGASTARLVEAHFVCEALGPHVLEASAQPLPLFRVLAPSLLNLKGQTPFVGREAEMVMLRDRWTQAKDGFGQVVLLNGEPGIGKSRLVHMMKDHLSDVAYILECRCSPYYQHSVFYPIIEVLEHQLLHWVPGEAPEAKLYKLELFLSECALPLADTVPLLASLLSLPNTTERYAPLHLTSQQQRQKILETLLSIVLTLATEHPMLLIIEDLHWMDPSTQELLDHLIERIPTQRLYAVFTYRSEFQAPWGNRSYITPMPLARLSRSYAEQIVSHVTGKKALPEAVLGQIIDKTDGVPLFVEEFTKSLIEAGTMQEVDGRYELLTPLQAMTIPATLHDSLMARLDRLEIAKRVAQLGAVLGRQFDYALLKAMWEQDEHLLQRGLNRLVEAELLYQQGRLPQAGYTFKHALIQDTAYQSLLKRTRQQYHKRVAQVLTEQFPDIAALQPEIPARHYTEAGLMEQAIPYWKLAGDLAVERSANAEAVSHFKAALELAASLPTTSAKTQLELSLNSALGPPLRMIKGHTAAEVEHVYQKVHDLSLQIGNEEQRFSALIGLGRLYVNLARLHEAHQLAVQCLALAQQIGEPILLLEAHRILGQTLLFQGQPGLAEPHFEHGVTLYASHRGRLRAIGSGMDPGVVVTCYLAWTRWLLGYPKQALVRIQQALDLARETSHAYTLAFALNYAAVLYSWALEPRLAQMHAENLLSISKEHGFIQFFCVEHFWQDWSQMTQGTIQDCQIPLPQDIRQWHAINATLELPHRLAMFVEAHKQRGNPTLWIEALNQVINLVDQSGIRLFEAELYRLRGEVLLRKPKMQQRAECDLRRALDTAHTQGAASLALRAALSLGRLRRQQGQVEKARQMVQVYYDGFSEGFDTPDLQAARDFIEAL